MKIMHVITAFGIGGAEKMLLNIINKQIENNHIHLVYFKNKNDLISDLDSRVIVKQIPFSLFIVRELKKYYKSINPDIIHTHLGHGDLIGIWSARNLKSKIFCTMHNIYFKKNFLDLLFFKAYRILFLNVVKKGHIISISKSVEEHVLNRLKIPKKRSHLLLNAIPLKKIEPAQKKNEINILFVGRLEKQKSISTLIKAFKKNIEHNLEKNLNLNIIGDGSLKLELQKLVADLKIKNRVHFKGEQKNIDVYYAKSDIFVLPSIWEGFGIVILEAFRAKLAVIASNIEGPAELIKDNYNGLLFEPQNVLELTDKINYLINNKYKREEISEKGFKTFTSEYSINNYVKRLIKLYLNA